MTQYLRPFLVGLQLDIAWEDKAVTHERVRDLLEGQAFPRGSLLALPEMFSTGFSMNVPAIAEGPDRPTEHFLSSLAAERGIFVLGGVVNRAPDGRGRNEARLYGPEGEERLRYQKIHPFRYGGETSYFEPGSQLALFEWNGFHAAPFICYDLRFPEVFRQSVRDGADLLIVIANWPRPREEHWMALLKARAIENQSYVMGVNRCGSDPNVSYSGRSQIIGPRGNILVDAGEGEGLFHISPDRDDLIAYRAEFPALVDINPAFLGERMEL